MRMLIRIVTADRLQGEALLRRCKQGMEMDGELYDNMPAALTAMRLAPADLLFIAMDHLPQDVWEGLEQMRQVDPQLCFACLTDAPQHAHRAFAMGALDVLPNVPRDAALAFVLARAVQAGQGLIQMVSEQTPMPQCPCIGTLLAGVSAQQRGAHRAFVQQAQAFVAQLRQQPVWRTQLPDIPDGKLALAMSLCDAGHMLFERMPPVHTRLYAAIQAALPKLTYAFLAQCQQEDVEQLGAPFWMAAIESALYANAWVDGHGEPAALQGGHIPLCARICAVVREAQRQLLHGASREEALLQLKRRAGAQLDGDLVAAFCQIQA